ncbi:peptidase M3, partial [Achlya hypogyna]
MATISSNNPLLADWSSQPFELPPFELIQAEHFKPAIETAQEAQLEELKQIAENPDAPTFANTIVAFDRSGQLYAKVLGVFYNLTSSCSPPELQAVELEMAGPLAAFQSKVTTFPGLFDRIDAVYESRDQFQGEDLRLLERIHLDFVRSGARFDKETQARYNDIMTSLAELTTKFSQNVMSDESDVTIELSTAEMTGCPDDMLASAKQNAIDRNAGDDKYVVTLSRSMVEPFLTYATDRAVRERVFRA